MADTTNASLTPEAIRLECLRLANRPDRDAQQIINRAAEFERFVLVANPPTTASEPPKQTDKPTAKARSKSS